MRVGRLLLLFFLLITTLSAQAQELKERLLSDDPYVCTKAVTEAKGLDEKAKAQLVLHLSQRIRDPRTAAERGNAALVMGQFGSVAIPEAMQLLHSPDASIRHWASLALGTIGEPAIPSLLAVLQESGTEVRCSAARALGAMPKAARPSVSALVPASKDPDPVLRACIAEVFGRMGGPGALKVLIELLADPAKEVRWAALNALNPFGPSACEAVPRVIGLAREGDSITREIAYRTLGQIGASHPGVVEVLRRGVREDRSGNAVFALGEMGPDGASAVPDLISVLMTASPGLRGTIALSLSKIGPAAKDAVPALMQIWVDSEPYHRAQAVEAVGKIGSASIPALIVGLRDENPAIRSGAAWQLGEFRGASAQAVPSLILMLQDEDPSVRMSAGEALSKIGTREALAAASKASTDQINPWTVEGKKLWTKAEIATPIPPPDGQRNALKLDAEVRIPGPGAAVLLATVHRGDGSPDFLAVWRPVGERFERVTLEGWDESEDDRTEGILQEPAAFGYGNERFIHLEVRLPGTGFIHLDTFYWIAPDLALHKVPFQPAPAGYLDKLKKGEGVWKGEMNKFADDKMTFEFSIWKEGDGNCCPSGGYVKGEYKLVGQRQFDPARRTWSANFKIVPATFARNAFERQ